MKHYYYSFFFTLIVLGLSAPLWAQNFVIKGRVLEAGSEEPLPFVHLFYKEAQIGTTSNMDGYFKLEIYSATLPSDSLIISSLGYKSKRVYITQSVELTITLEPDRTQLDEALVVPGINPAFAVMDKIIANKPSNNPKELDSYTCDEYSKIRFDLNHINDKTKENFLLKPFDYVWSYSNTTKDGVEYLPVLLVENVSEHYYQKNPKDEKSIVKAKKVTGLPGPKILEFVNDLYFSPNVYEDYVSILEKNFPSPLNKNYKNHYHYFLDSNGTGSSKEYHIAFIPKQERNLAFVGEMTIDAATFAVKTIQLRFDIMANVNFVRSYLVKQEFQKLENEHWMLKYTDVIGDFTVIENSSELTGFYGTKRSIFQNYKINQALDPQILKGSQLVLETDSSQLKTEEYWKSARPEELTTLETSLHKMVKQVETDPKFIFRKNLVMGVATGYIPQKTIEIGDVYTFYSYNYVEHSRLKFGLRTAQNLDFPLSGSAYVAYGTYDEKWKYQVAGEFAMGKKDGTRLGLQLTDDIMQLGRSVNAIAIDHIITSFLQIGDATSRLYEQDVKAYVEQNLAVGLEGRVGYFNNTLRTTDTIKFWETNTQGTISEVNNYHSAGLSLSFKYNWQNKKVRGDFYSKENLRKNFRKWPDIGLMATYASKEFGSDFNFQKVKLSLSQHVHFKSIGYFKYYLEAGKTFGTVPYPYLDIPFSNQLVLYDDFAFNLMKYAEFMADQYFTGSVQQHFDGALLDRVPYVNRLKWRSFIFAKAYWGSLSDVNNESQYLFSANSSKISSPYTEIGFGLENIFKLARVDFVWRLNDATQPNTYGFLIKPSFKFSF